MAAYEAEVQVGSDWTLVSGGVSSGANVTIQSFGSVEIRAGGASAPSSDSHGIVLSDGGLILSTKLDEITPNESAAAEVWARAVGGRQNVTVRIWHG